MRILRTLAVITPLLFASTAKAETYQFATFNYPPYEFQENGKPRGIAVDLVVEGMHRLGHTVEIKFYPFARLLEEAKVGTIDGLFTAFKTPEREAYLTYSHEVVAPQIISLFVGADSPLHFDGDLAALSEASIGIVNKVSYGKIFDKALADGLFKKIEPTNDGDININKLLNGRLDCVVTNKYGALYLIKKLGADGKIRELAPPLDDVPSFIAFTKARDMTGLAAAFDDILKAMRADGTYDKILSSYVQ